MISRSKYKYKKLCMIKKHDVDGNLSQGIDIRSYIWLEDHKNCIEIGT